MPTTIDAAFNQFLSTLSTQRGETVAAANHRASVQQCLHANYGIIGFFLSGSFGHGTNVTGYSDADRFAIFPANRLYQDSAQSLGEIAQVLRQRFPTTGVRVDAPGIRLPFGYDGAELNEVIPVHQLSGDVRGYRIFGMPDGGGGWIRAIPEAHNAFVDHHHQRLSNKLKPLIRFLKAWKYARGVPVKSFYLEMRAAAFAAKEQAIIYGMDLRSLFMAMAMDGLADVPDPFAVVNPVTACNTANQYLQVQAAARSATDIAQDALWAEQNGRTVEAFHHWNNLFNGIFPAYG
ncbi:MAG TPA: nucleotidyltransferase [Candidatus Sulfotelmatobacter sp.]|nr:nucleotidyltransferase [Candidatus Sulfotelmatobacter sp.]